MKSVFIVGGMLCATSIGWAQSSRAPARMEAEHYVTAYAQHYRVPVALVRAIVVRESNWQPCAISPKGASGLMQLMPATAKRLGVANPCNLDQNVSGGVRYLAWLMRQFHNDLRLVVAAYYTGEDKIGRRGSLTEIPTLSRTSQQLEQLTFEKQALNQKTRTPHRREM